MMIAGSALSLFKKQALFTRLNPLVIFQAAGLRKQDLLYNLTKALRMMNVKAIDPAL